MPVESIFAANALSYRLEPDAGGLIAPKRYVFNDESTRRPEKPGEVPTLYCPGFGPLKYVEISGTLDLPQKLVGIESVVLANVPVMLRTFVSLNATVAVADCPSSKLVDWPTVVPPKLMGPEEFSAMSIL